MKSTLVALAFLLCGLSTQAYAATAQASDCSSRKWLVSIHSPSSGQEMASFFQAVATDQFQPVLRIQRLTANAESSQDYGVNLLVEFQFQDVGIYTFQQALELAEKTIGDIAKMPHTKVACDGVSRGGGHLSGSN